MQTQKHLAEEIHQQGFAVIESVITKQEIAALSAELEDVASSEAIRKRGGIFAIRNLLNISQQVKATASLPQVRALIEAVLGTSAIPVRGILFDKIPDANWKVPWHQDVTIAVREKVETEGFGPWSIKAEVLHVQPPASILENILSIRLHLDDCHEENGALRVLLGSHRQGRIAEENIAALRATNAEHICAAKAGSALLMRPLLLHASSPSQTPGHRRVIHIDYAAIDLPNGLQWLSDN